MFQFRWLRSFIRRNTGYIPEDRAAIVKHRLSIVYSIIAWNAFGFVAYLMYTGKTQWSKKYEGDKNANKTPAQQWARTLGIKDAKVYRISGFNVHNYEIHDNADENEQPPQAVAEDAELLH